jgi:hypothetical protein
MVNVSRLVVVPLVLCLMPPSAAAAEPGQESRVSPAVTAAPTGAGVTTAAPRRLKFDPPANEAPSTSAQSSWSGGSKPGSRLRKTGIILVSLGVPALVAGLAWGMKQEDDYTRCWNSAASRGDYRSAAACEEAGWAPAVIAGSGVVATLSGVPLWIVGQVKVSHAGTGASGQAAPTVIRSGDHHSVAVTLGPRSAALFGIRW